MALKTHLALYMPYIYITCDPTNLASARTIEKAGGVFQEVVDVPKNHIVYKMGSTHKNIYIIDLSSESLGEQV